jgi:hypothetical protein
VFAQHAQHTINLLSLGPSALRHLARLLEVDVPALRLALGILQRKGEDGICLLDGRLTFARVSAEGAGDEVERR